MSVDLERAGVGLDLAADSAYVIAVMGDEQAGQVFVVPSCSYGTRKKYSVFRDEDRHWKCTCPDFLSRRLPCKHIIAVVKRYFPTEAPEVSEIALKALRTVRRSLAGGERSTERVRSPHVPQSVASPYSESTLKDHAIVRQPSRILSLLSDLSETMNRSQPTVRLPGGQFINPGDLAFMMLYREYQGLSQRLFEKTMHDLHSQRFISQTRCKSSRMTYQKSIKTYEMLMQVYRIVTSAFRLESTFFVDGTGLSTYYVSNYFEKVHGPGDIRIGTPWVHCNAVLGEWSKAILAFTVTESSGKGTGEVSQFPVLLKSLKLAGFKNGQYVVTDNLYILDQCFEVARSHGMELLGNTKPRNFDKSGNIKSAEIARMRDLITRHHLESKVKKRAIIESCFGTVKRKGKHTIMSVGSDAERAIDPNILLYVSRRNEILCRVIVQVLQRINAMEVMTGCDVSFKDDRPFSIEAFDLVRDRDLDAE